MTFRPARKLVPFEEHVLATADRFFATVSLGRGQYDKREASSLDEILALAPALCALHGRSVVIYARRDSGGEAVVGSWEYRAQ